MSYIPRIVDGVLDEFTDGLPAVAIEGAKGVGKTETAQRRAATVYRLDDPAIQAIARADVRRLLQQPAPILLDEWQRFPPIWDAVRRAVDEGAAPGSFILTGSASPDRPSPHSGAARIVTLRLRPLTLSERARGQGSSVSVKGLLGDERPKIEGHTDWRLEDYTWEIIRSGLPGLQSLEGRLLRTQLSGYLDRIVDTDLVELGRNVRHPHAVKRWMTAYAAATATTATYETIRDAATPGEGDKPARGTTRPYRDLLERLWILDPVPAWMPSRSHISRLTRSPKHHLCDPALAARLLGVGTEALLQGYEPGPSVPRDGTLLGHLFESLVTMSLRVYAESAEASLFHMRTSGGDREVDLIIERDDSRIVAIEVKLSSAINDEDVENLHWLRRKIGSDMIDAIVVTTGTHAYRREDGIAVVPAALLGA